MQVSPVNYRALFAIESIGLPLAGILTSVTTVACCRGINKISHFIHQKERQYERGSWQDMACKVGRFSLFISNLCLSALGFVNAALFSSIAARATILLAGNVPLLIALIGVTLTTTSYACAFLLGAKFVPKEVLGL